MKNIDVDKWNRSKTYNWFKTFTDSTYSCNVIMDVTNLVEYTKLHSSSFFINMLYLVVKGLNSVEEMRMRIVDGKPVIYEDINPAYTVMTKTGDFENVRHSNYKSYKTFYEIAKENIETAKKQDNLKSDEYNPENSFNEYYITCLPWVNFTQMTHPIPDSVESQCVPRICWGKYEMVNGRYKLTLNITVSHIFVDGYPLSKAFINIQDLLNNAEIHLKIDEK